MSFWRARPRFAAATQIVGGLTLGLGVSFAAGVLPSPSSPTSLGAAEQVAARFVSGFESYSASSPPTAGAAGRLAAMATPELAARITAPAQGGPSAALAAEHFSATATVTGSEVEADTPTLVDLLVRTVIRESTRTGTTTTVRLVPVSLTPTTEGWAVSDIDGLIASAGSSRSGGSSSPESRPAAGAGGSTPASGSGAAGDGPASPAGGTPSPSVTAATVTATVVHGSVGDIPAAYLAWTQGAVAAECPGLPWTVLAAIAEVESDFGRSTLPGVTSGANPWGAEGPMQFEPATFAAYATVAPGGADPASPYDPADAVYSAAKLLCADGGGNPGGLYAAIFAYNHSDAYVSLVLAYSSAYEQDAVGAGATTVSASTPGSGSGSAGGGSAGGGSAGAGTGDGAPVGLGLASVIVADAEAYLGTLYVWGGENPKIGFDCSGLVQWVYAEAGLSLPRVAQDQYDAGPHVAAGAPLYAGDLVFFGSGPAGVEHVGIYVGNGEMIDAPHTGAVVRFDHITGFDPAYVGATRPDVPNLGEGAGVPVVNPVATISTTATPLDGSGGSSSPPHPGSWHPPAGTSAAPGGTTEASFDPWRGEGSGHGPGSWAPPAPGAGASTTTSTSTPTRHHRGRRGPAGGAGTVDTTTVPTTTVPDPVATTVPTTTVPTTPTTTPGPTGGSTTTTTAPGRWGTGYASAGSGRSYSYPPSGTGSSTWRTRPTSGYGTYGGGYGGAGYGGAGYGGAGYGGYGSYHR